MPRIAQEVRRGLVYEPHTGAVPVPSAIEDGRTPCALLRHSLPAGHTKHEAAPTGAFDWTLCGQSGVWGNPNKLHQNIENDIPIPCLPVIISYALPERQIAVISANRSTGSISKALDRRSSFSMLIQFFPCSIL